MDFKKVVKGLGLSSGGRVKGSDEGKGGGKGVRAAKPLNPWALSAP